MSLAGLITLAVEAGVIVGLIAVLLLALPPISLGINILEIKTFLWTYFDIINYFVPLSAILGYFACYIAIKFLLIRWNILFKVYNLVRSAFK